MNTINKLAERTRDAYSYNAYGPSGWSATIALLRRREFDDRQVEAIMRSKHTRWAHDDSNSAYGKMTARSFGDYMDKHPNWFIEGEVRKLMLGTFATKPKSKVVKNPYGYGLTKRELDALRWSADRRTTMTDGYFITGPGLTRYKGMCRRAPTKLVGRLLDRGMVYRNDEMARMAGMSDMEVYSFTARAIHVLAKNGGYEVGDQVWIEN